MAPPAPPDRANRLPLPPPTSPSVLFDGSRSQPVHLPVFDRSTSPTRLHRGREPFGVIAREGCAYGDMEREKSGATAAAAVCVKPRVGAREALGVTCNSDVVSDGAISERDVRLPVPHTDVRLPTMTSGCLCSHTDIKLPVSHGAISDGNVSFPCPTPHVMRRG